MPPKFRGMNFGVREMVRVGLLNPVCTLESPGALLTFRCPGWIHQNPGAAGRGVGEGRDHRPVQPSSLPHARGRLSAPHQGCACGHRPPDSDVGERQR